MFRVRLDGFDHQVQLVGAVDFPQHAPVLVGRDDLGFAEVVQPIDTAGRIISHDEHNTRTVLRPREQKQMVGAEVEHRREGKKKTVEREPEESPRPIVSAVEGLPGGLLRKRDIATVRRMIVCPPNLLTRGLGGRSGML